MTKLRSPFSTGFTDSAADDLAYLLKVLADPSRLKILALLHSGPHAIHELTDRLGTLKQPTVSHHVKILAQAGLVTKQRISTSVLCQMVPGRMAAIAHLLDPGGAA